MPARRGEHYDVLVVGSGFGGSVTALRLTEKGYRVGVLEAGRRFTPDTLPRTSWQVRDFLWAPRLGCYGIQRIHVLRDLVVLAGAGVGGGSLNYANTLYRPKNDAFYRDPQWAEMSDWRDELDVFYDQATRMLGVVTQPSVTPSDVVMRQVAEERGRGDTVTPTQVGVYFGEGPGVTSPDPFFGGAGPARTGCLECGECMTGCRHGAKNTLETNYLALAESAGAVIHPETTVRTVRPTATGYAVDTRGTRRRRQRITYTADQVVFAAGTWGTQSLLHRLRDTGVLPGISARLGDLTRTNSEALVGAMARRPPERGGPRDFTRGVAITSSWHPDEDTHIEPCRYGYGSNAMGLLTTLITDGGGRAPRVVTLLGAIARHPLTFARSLDKRRWSERTVIALVMQSLDNSIAVRRRFGRLVSRQGHGTPNPTWIPAANDTVRRIAEIIDGDPGGTWGEAINMPMTAHFIGGCPIGPDPDHGVVDGYQRLYGHRGLHVVDGSALSANLGVNPSLTITAQAERAMAFWPNKGETDPRPALGEPYRRLDPIAPHHPVVPAHAPGALRLVPLGTPPCRPAPRWSAGRDEDRGVAADVLLFSNSRPPGAEVPFAHAADPLRAHVGDRRVWFVPWAGHDVDAYTGWVADALGEVLGGLDVRGLHREPDPAATIRDADPDRETVFVGGGNTFRLRRRTGDNGVLEALRDRADLRYAGASAGSNLACPTIMTTNDMPIVDPGGLDALGRLPVQINPHYLDPDPRSTHRGETREERIHEFHEENAVAVVGLREGAWLHRTRSAAGPDHADRGGERLTLGGYTARLFRRGHEPVELAAGTDLSWLLMTPSS